MSGLGFDNIVQPTIAQKIVDQICQAIIDGRYRPGDRLPTEAELAKIFNVGRNSVREAIKMLECLGLLEIRRAEGTFIVDKLSKGMINPLIYAAILGGRDTVGEMIQFQIMMDKATSQFCAIKATDDEKMQIKEAHDKLQEALSREPYDMNEINKADRYFHKLIVEYTHNEFAIIVTSAIWDLFDKTIDKEIEMIMKNDPTYMKRLHQGIFNGIINSNANEASDAIPFDYFIDRHNLR
mgnify:FL=1